MDISNYIYKVSNLKTKLIAKSVNEKTENENFEQQEI